MGKTSISLYGANVTCYFLFKVNFHVILSSSITLKSCKLRNTKNNIRNPDSVFPVIVLVKKKKNECLSSLLSWGSWVLVKITLFEYLSLCILNDIILSKGIGMILEFYRSLSDWYSLSHFVLLGIGALIFFGLKNGINILTSFHIIELGTTFMSHRNVHFSIILGEYKCISDLTMHTLHSLELKVIFEFWDKI